MLNLFEGKDTKALRRALELTKQRAAIDEELKGIRAQLGAKLEKTPDKTFKLEGEGLACVQETNRVVLNMDLLYKMLAADPKLLEQFTKEMCIVKQTNLEKFLGTPVYKRLIQGTQTSKTIRFVVK